MHRSLTLVLAIAVGGCSAASESAPSAKLSESLQAETVAGTYVKTSVVSVSDNPRHYQFDAPPFVTTDITCGPSHDQRYQTMTLGDTMVINADGTARWGVTSAQYLNGAQSWVRHDSWDGFFGGSWDATGYHFYGGYPSFRIGIRVMNSETGELVEVSDRNFRLEADGSISTEGGLGGGCGSQGGDVQASQYTTDHYRKL